MATATFLLCIMCNLFGIEEDGSGPLWCVSASVLQPGVPGAFDEVAVKDPSVVYFEGNWHLFYTARSQGQYSIGYTAAATLEKLNTATRYELHQLHGNTSSYAAAPQVFFFTPKRLWCLIYQTKDSNYQPVIATTTTIAEPASWSAPIPLVEKQDSAKWIDFWVLCDKEIAYLFYTRNHQDVCVMTTGIADFPSGFSDAKTVFSPVHEAVHVYKVKGKMEYHMICEFRDDEDIRHFGLATASHPLGPWEMTDECYAVGRQMIYPESISRWTEEISHGEAIRTGYDQQLEYDPSETRLLIQGLPEGAHTGPYEMLPWWLGVIELED